MGWIRWIHFYRKFIGIILVSKWKSKKETYILITSDENSFEEFYTAFKNQKSVLNEEHLVIHLSKSFNTKNSEVSLFLEYAEQKKENGTSFVIVDTNIDIDDFPETFNITPTLQEAEDVLEMEAIERELGF